MGHSAAVIFFKLDWDWIGRLHNGSALISSSFERNNERLGLTLSNYLGRSA